MNLVEHRRRVWGLCYRMTGERQAADELAQEALARAVERGGEAGDFEPWLYRVATNVCLDWLRRRAVERRVLRLVDPVDLDEAPFAGADAESRLLRRDDLRLAVMTSLQALPPRQRAVLLLREVLDRSTEETAQTLGLSAANVKVLLHRARARLDEVHRVGVPDAPVDAAVVERFARALEAGDLDGLARLLADDVWGLVDDGVSRRRPTLARRAVTRQWANAMRRYGRADAVRRVRLNGEAALLVVVGGCALASIHLETRAGLVVSIRTLLDPPRLARLGFAA
jgi:RNA polymerase sigma factor (sigma-70 family)